MFSSNILDISSIYLALEGKEYLSMLSSFKVNDIELLYNITKSKNTKGRFFTPIQQVEFIHSLGLKVNVWTVNSLEDGERMVEYGVDYITTNILE